MYFVGTYTKLTCRFDLLITTFISIYFIAWTGENGITCTGEWIAVSCGMQNFFFYIWLNYIMGISLIF